jgi:hypothetical protein
LILTTPVGDDGTRKIAIIVGCHSVRLFLAELSRTGTPRHHKRGETVSTVGLIEFLQPPRSRLGEHTSNQFVTGLGHFGWVG